MYNNIYLYRKDANRCKIKDKTLVFYMQSKKYFHILLITL